MPRLHRRFHHRAARHVGRGAHHLLRWFGGITAVLILVALVGIWRLMQGPIELDWLAPYAEAALARSGIGLKVAISGMRFGFDHTTHRLDLRAVDVRVALPNGDRLASFPEMVTSFSLPALLGGRLAPTQVIVERPELHLVRGAGGTITARIGSDDVGGSELGPQLIQELAGPPRPDTPLGLLHAFRISGATIVVDDRHSGRSWRIEGVDLAITRSGKGARGDVSLAVPMGNSMPELHASYRFLAERHLLDLDMTFDGVQPADIPPLIPEILQLQHVDAPISGAIRARIDVANGMAQGSRVDLALGKGRVHSDWLPAGTVPVNGGEFHAVYAPENAEVRVEKMILDLGGGTQFAVDGTVAGVSPELIAAPADARPAGHVTAKINAALRHAPVERFGELWPAAFSPGARRWTLANIRHGVLDEAAMQLGLDLDPVAHTGNIVNAHGSLRYQDLTINYFDGLPLARAVNGTAVFAGNRLDFTPTGGNVKGLKVTGGSLHITELDTPLEWLTIDLNVAGPLQDALDVIDSKPLNYARAVGIDPARVGGRVETQLHFKLPLLAALKLDQIEYGAKATIVGAAIEKAVLDRSLTDGNVSLDIGRVGAHVQGSAKFDGIPAKLDANVPFHSKNGPHAVYKVGLILDAEAQRRLQLDAVQDRLQGLVGVDVTYQMLAANRGEATALLDLRGAALSIPEAGWKKPVGQPATAKIVLELDNNRIARVPQIDVEGPGLEGHLSALLGADRKQIDRVDIRRLAVGNTDVKGTVMRRAEGGWRADIHAARADASHMIKDATAVPPAAASPPLALNAHIDRLVFGPQRELRQVSAEMLRTGGAWHAGRIQGRYGNGREMSLRFGEGGGQRLIFQTDDLGAALQLLDISDGVSGGKLTVDGQLTEMAGKRTLRAHVEGDNYTLVRAPTMARILALPSLTGFASMLSGSGLPFMTLRGDFTYSGNHVTLHRLLASGEAIGVTANGWIDLERDWLELQGTVAPAYALNSLIGNVPIIGTLLGGGSQGMFAANYRLSGPENNPQVTVNPLSALTPGILRQLFAPIVGLPPPPQHQAAQ